MSENKCVCVQQIGDDAGCTFPACQRYNPLPLQDTPSLPFGLSEAELKQLLERCLKPEEIAGEPPVQLGRVRELIHWFLRFATGSANPKWFQSHAYELVYYIATNAGNRSIDMRSIEQKAFLEGVMISPLERKGLESIGRIPAPAEPSLPKQEGKMPKLDIAVFSKLSAERAETGFKTYRNVPITYWTTALMGEGGELCNMIKKMERVAHGGIDGGSTYTAASLSKEDLAEEIGGMFIYLNILSGLLGIDMEDAIIETFNFKSKKYGFSQFYPISTPDEAWFEERRKEIFERIRKDKQESDGPVFVMSDELAASSDMAAIEYAKDWDKYDVGDIVDAHEAGQSWMYSKLQPELSTANAQIEDLTAELEQARVKIKAQTDWIHSHV